MAIEVEAAGGGEPARFKVRVEGRGFEVTVAEAEAEHLGAGDALSLVRASFEFLLEREPSSSILPRFDLAVIERYFPEWREEMQRRFSSD
jgi:hypothetical protein